MGAEPWSTSAPYRPDIAEVLAQTRARVFAAGLYAQVPGRTFASLDELDRFFMCEPGDPEWDDDEMMAGAGGTASILDVRGVSESREPGVTAPLPEAVRRAIFGTATPTLADCTEDRESDVYDQLGRGESHYLVLYDGDRPVEVRFYGYSWD
jgi:hypothetical protein